MNNQFTEHEIPQSRELKFITAGKAIFTIKNIDTNNRFTYKFVKSRNNPNLFWTYVLTGSDNENHYKFIGGFSIDQGFKFSHKQTQITKDALSVRAIAWYTKWLLLNRLPTDYIKTYHMSHCGRCGRTLTVPESIISGYGPECVNLVDMETTQKGLLRTAIEHFKEKEFLFAGKSALDESGNIKSPYLMTTKQLQIFNQ